MSSRFDQGELDSPAAPSTVNGALPRARWHARVRTGYIAQYGVILAMVLTFIIFSILRPDSFFTLLTMKAILRDAAPLMIVAVGATFVLAVNDFDLSLGGITAMTAVVAIMAVSSQYLGLPPALAVVVALCAGALLGLVNGALVAYLKVPSIILTIAMGTVFTGISLQMAGSKTIYEGVPAPYLKIAGGNFLGFSSQVWVALALLLAAYITLNHTVWGRHMYAIGGNPVAASLSGIRVNALKMTAFVVAAASAALSAVLLTSQVGNVNPNTGVGQLLPAYAAVFLGASIFRGGTFSVLGSALGALYLQMIGTGLILMSLSNPIVQITQGGILAAAIILSRTSR